LGLRAPLAGRERQLDDEGRAAARRALHRDRSPALRDDSLCAREGEAADDERLEEMCARLVVELQGRAVDDEPRRRGGAGDAKLRHALSDACERREHALEEGAIRKDEDGLRMYRDG